MHPDRSNRHDLLEQIDNRKEQLMELLKSYWEFAHLAVEYNLHKAGVDVRDERGAVSTEMAVVMAAMVAIAVVAGAIFLAKAQSNANNIPDTVDAPVPG